MEVNGDLFSDFAASSIAQNIPRCYVEDWQLLKDKTKNLNLPNTTDLLYVGSGVITDECLRLYLAQQIGIGSKLITSQHGGTYGISLIKEKTEYVEQRVSDKWISWGWKSKKRENVIPGPALKGKIKLKLQAKRDLMLVTLPPVRFSPSRLNYSDPYEIVQSHIDFIKSLDPEISNNTLIRPAPNHRFSKYITEFESDFNVSKKGSLWDDISKSKLFLCTHNGTTMLESLHANFPTIILLPKYKFYTQHYVREEAIPMIDEMKRVGIYFSDPEEARKKINLIWPDVNSWWEQNEIQEVVKFFCDMYSRRSDDFLDSLAKAINVN